MKTNEILNRMDKVSNRPASLKASLLGMFIAMAMGWVAAGMNPAFAEPAAAAAVKDGFYPGACNDPLNSFSGSNYKEQSKIYLETLKKIDDCRGGMVYVSRAPGDYNWDVLCDRSVQSQYVMKIPQSIRNSGKRYSVYNRTGKGTAFALDRLPTESKEAGQRAYFTSVCNKTATVNFEVSNCKTFSFNSEDYKSGKTPVAILTAEAADDCDKIAKNTDVNDSHARLVKRKVVPDLQKCSLK